MGDKKFTKSEWIAKKGNKKALEYDAWIESGGKIIFVATGVASRKTKISNANLIAAAPEMYEMLNDIKDSIAELELRNEIEKLLAKARGEK